MSKRLILVLALAFVVGIAFTAYAEVQNVKVSGDITVMGVYRDNTDLSKEKLAVPTGVQTAVVNSDTQKSFLSFTRVRVDADLTDNVSTVVRLLNERVWGRETDTSNGNASGRTTVDIDLAYATLKEFLYSPLTLTVGRQELHFGNDFIIGDPDTNGIALGSNLPRYQQDLSMRKAFDAVRATLNYKPLVIDIVWSKISEANIAQNDDITLSGINANYSLDKNTNIEGYGWAKLTDTGSAKLAVVTNNPQKPDKVFTVGGKIRNTSVKDLTLGLESAFQFGTYNPGNNVNAPANALTSGRRQAWALEAIGVYDLKDMKMIGKYSPSLTAAYIFLSGDNAHQKRDDKTWHGWDPMFENQTSGHLINVIMGFSNAHIVSLSGKIKPVEDITMNLDYVYLWLSKAFRTGDGIVLDGATGNSYIMTHGKHLGQEVDAKVTYDYTEDVQFSLLGGWFVPGSAFEKNNNPASGIAGGRSTASEVIGSMKVTF